MRWRPAYVALGSNLGEPATQLRDALLRLGQLPQTRLLARSQLWRSPPFGPVAQPDFVNAAAGLLTRLEPAELLAELQSIERDMGRTGPRLRWGPRLIDLDLVACGAGSLEQPGLSLPHPGVHERNFVLYPLAEFAPALWIAGRGRVSRLAADIGPGGLEPLGE